MKRFSCLAILAGTFTTASSVPTFEPVFTQQVVNRWAVVECKVPENFVLLDSRSVPELREAPDRPMPPLEGRKSNDRKEEYAAVTDARISVEGSQGGPMRKRGRLDQIAGKVKFARARGVAL